MHAEADDIVLLQFQISAQANGQSRTVVAQLGVSVFASGHRAHQRDMILPLRHILPDVLVDRHVREGDALERRMQHKSIFVAVLAMLLQILVQQRIGGRR